MSIVSQSLQTICIGGAPSSGTTLLADLMDSVPQAACPPELYVFCSESAYTFDERFKQEAAEAVPLPNLSCYAAPTPFVNRKYLPLLGLDESGLQSMIERATDLSDFWNLLTDHYAGFRDRPINMLAEKTPININCAKHFCQAFPDGLFIHVVRDGRSMVASLIHRGYTIYEAALIWMLQVHAAEAVSGMPNVMEVRYEDLVHDPFETAAEIAARAGHEVAPQEIADHFSSNQYRAALPRVSSWSVPQFTGEVHEPAPFQDRLSAKNIAWLESLELFRLTEPGKLVRITSFIKLLQKYQYPPSEGNRVPLGLDRMNACYREYVRKSRNLEVQADYRLFMQMALSDEQKQALNRWRAWVFPFLSTPLSKNPSLTPEIFVQLAGMLSIETELLSAPRGRSKRKTTTLANRA